VEQTGNLIFDRVAAINQQVIIDTPFRRLNGSAFLALNQLLAILLETCQNLF